MRRSKFHNLKSSFWPAALQNLGQHGTVAEGVDVEHGIGRFSEVFHEPPLAVQPLPDIAFPGGRIAVRLQPPSTQHSH